MKTIAVILSIITGLLFLMSGLPKVFGVPAAMSAKVRASFEHFGLPSWVRLGTGAAELAITAGLWIAAATGNGGLAVASAAIGMFILLGAVAFHVRAKDRPSELVPALVYLALCIATLASAA